LDLSVLYNEVYICMDIKEKSDNSNNGLVILLGAGPGDPSLITQAGIEWLRWAEIVVYDRLACPELMKHCRPGTEYINVGKIPTQHAWQQDQINQQLVDLCKAGRRVVRLKGGDPLIFGRGGEEAIALREAGCAYRIVPGLTAAIAAGAMTGIPLTHRGVASSVTFVTGHEDPTKGEESLNYEALAGVDTLVFYMGVSRLPDNVKRLISAGRSADTPAAIIEKASTPSQRVIEGTLGELPGLAEAHNVAAPALVIVGEVAALREQIDWQRALPLAGQTVLITRPREQAAVFAGELATMGARVLEAPSVTIGRPKDRSELQNAVAQLSTYDIVAFTSANGVAAVFDVLAEAGLDARALGGVRIATVGQATATVLRAHGLVSDVMPDQFTTRALGETLVAEGVSGKRILLPRADLATTELPEVLEAGGAIVENVVAYQVSPAKELPADALGAIENGHVDWLTFTSAATARNFLTLAVKHELTEKLTNMKVASIGPVTTQAIVELGLSVTVEANPHTIAGLTRAIETFDA
jgi:uroporphyrinogen III methyltransferase / synthase